jgi:hypothetical protein
MSDVHVNCGNLEAMLMDKNTFASLVKENTIWILECIFAPPTSIWKEGVKFKDIFALDLPRLRRSVKFEVSRWHSRGKRKGSNLKKYMIILKLISIW